jgi:hypothetical protein
VPNSRNPYLRDSLYKILGDFEYVEAVVKEVQEWLEYSVSAHDYEEEDGPTLRDFIKWSLFY